MDKTNTLIFLFFFSSITFGVFQKSELKKSPIIGTWIKRTNHSDSLIFLPEYGSNPIFRLQRGFDPNDRTKLPKAFSGPYWYKLERNSISISGFLSSDSRFHSYYFWQSKDKIKLRIGNFFKDKKSQQDTLTFIKVK
jgi:hypothetical protein